MRSKLKKIRIQIKPVKSYGNWKELFFFLSRCQNQRNSCMEINEASKSTNL